MGRADFLDKSSLFNAYGFSVDRKTDRSFWPLHWHDCWELEIVTGGSGHQILNGQSFELARGSVYLLGPTDFQVQCRDLSLYTICFCDEKIPERFAATLSERKNRFRSCNEEELQPLLQICRLLYLECEENRNRYTHEATEHLLGYLFVILLRLFDVGQNTAEAEKEYAFPPVGRAVSYIHMHFREDPPLSEVAKFLCVTPNYFSERFHAVTGKRYKEYLTDVKLRYAKTLLETLDISATEVCFASGFSSFSNFLRQFKRRCGCSPVEWRKKNNKKSAAVTEAPETDKMPLNKKD